MHSCSGAKCTYEVFPAQWRCIEYWVTRIQVRLVIIGLSHPLVASFVLWQVDNHFVSRDRQLWSYPDKCVGNVDIVFGIKLSWFMLIFVSMCLFNVSFDILKQNNSDHKFMWKEIIIKYISTLLIEDIIVTLCWSTSWLSTLLSLENWEWQHEIHPWFWPMGLKLNLHSSEGTWSFYQYRLISRCDLLQNLKILVLAKWLNYSAKQLKSIERLVDLGVETTKVL